MVVVVVPSLDLWAPWCSTGALWSWRYAGATEEEEEEEVGAGGGHAATESCGLTWRGQEEPIRSERGRERKHTATPR